MSRALSSEFRAQIFPPQSPDAALLCLTIEDPQLAAPIRVVHNMESIVRTIDATPETFLPMFFGLELPMEDGHTLGQTRIIVENIDQQIALAVLLAQGKPKCTVELVLASDVDTVEVGPWVFFLDNAQITNMQVSAGAVGSHGLHNQHPADSRTPSTRPDLF